MVCMIAGRALKGPVEALEDLPAENLAYPTVPLLAYRGYIIHPNA